MSTVTSELQDPLEVGIYAGNADGDGGEMVVWFDDFVEADDPVTAVDAKHRVAVTWSALQGGWRRAASSRRAPRW